MALTFAAWTWYTVRVWASTKLSGGKMVVIAGLIKGNPVTYGSIWPLIEALVLGGYVRGVE